MAKLDRVGGVEIWVIARSTEGEWVTDEETGEVSFERARVYQRTVELTMMDADAPLVEQMDVARAMLGGAFYHIDRLRERVAQEQE